MKGTGVRIRIPMTEAGMFLKSMRLTTWVIRNMEDWELDFIRQRAMELRIKEVDKLINKLRNISC